jgi:hypothetical protein
MGTIGTKGELVDGGRVPLGGVCPGCAPPGGCPFSIGMLGIGRAGAISSSGLPGVTKGAACGAPGVVDMNGEAPTAVGALDARM